MGTTALLEVSHMWCDLLSELQNCEIDLRFRKTACMVWQLISGAVFMIHFINFDCWIVLPLFMKIVQQSKKVLKLRSKIKI